VLKLTLFGDSIVVSFQENINDDLSARLRLGLKLALKEHAGTNTEQIIFSTFAHSLCVFTLNSLAGSNRKRDVSSSREGPLVHRASFGLPYNW
jgi:hypothetical protein